MPSPKALSKGEVFRKGDIPTYLYFVVSGKIKQYKTNEDGKELIIDIHGEGDFFGYEALLEGTEYTDSAMAITMAELALIPKKDFFTLLYTNRDVANKFIEILSNKVTEKEEDLLNLAYNSVRQRTAEALISLYEKYDHQVSIAVSRDDLAHMVGTATESVIRVLSDFKAEEITPIFMKYTAEQLRAKGVDETGIGQYEAANPSWMSVAGLIRYWKKKNQ